MFVFAVEMQRVMDFKDYEITLQWAHKARKTIEDLSGESHILGLIDMDESFSIWGENPLTWF